MNVISALFTFILTYPLSKIAIGWLVSYTGLQIPVIGVLLLFGFIYWIMYRFCKRNGCYPTKQQLIVFIVGFSIINISFELLLLYLQQLGPGQSLGNSPSTLFVIIVEFLVTTLAVLTTNKGLKKREVVCS
jgi:hypothetical protein